MFACESGIDVGTDCDCHLIKITVKERVQECIIQFLIWTSRYWGRDTSCIPLWNKDRLFIFHD